MATLRVILSRPATGENIGFVARLIANFALDDLVLVRPLDGWEAGAARTASMCREVLDSAKILDELPEALHDCTHVFGFTARTGSQRETRDTRLLGQDCAAIEPEARIALLFGNEESGLSDQETELCTTLYRVGLPGMTSLNLSHAVAVALWELLRATDGEAPAEYHTLASVEDKNRFAESARTILAAIDFKVDDPHFEGALRRLVMGAQLQMRDLRILHRVLRHLEWRRQAPL